MVKMIFASDLNHGIGYENTLPWRLSSDLKRFKELTENKIVVMGSKTYLSLPEKFRPLPNRTNVVLTNNKDLQLDTSVIVINDLKEYIEKNKDKEIWIIGGASLYEQFIDLVDEIYHTRILDSFKVDTYFNILKYRQFKLYSSNRYNLEEDKGLIYDLDIYKKY